MTTSRNRYTGDGATNTQIPIPDSKSLNDYTAFPQTKVDRDFKLELPITESDNLKDALAAFKAPEAVIPDVKNVQGDQLYESTAKETFAFAAGDQLPLTFTIVLKRFNHDAEKNTTTKIGKAVEMPQKIVLSGRFYELSTVIYHQGSYERGHYTTSIKHGDTWKHHNDRIVSTHDSFAEDKDKGYVYVYRRGEAAGEGHAYPVL